MKSVSIGGLREESYKVTPVLNSDGPKNVPRPGRRWSMMVVFAGMIFGNYS